MANQRGAEPHKDLDAIISRNVLAQLRRDPPPAPKAHGEAPRRKDPPSGLSGLGSDDLVASMASRLASAEKALRERNLAAGKLQAENEALKSKLAVAEHEIAAVRHSAAGGAGDGTAAGDTSHLVSECSRLRSQNRLAWQQVAELKAFLNDYGMVWVGGKEQDPQDKLAAAGYPPGHPAGHGVVANSHLLPAVRGASAKDSVGSGSDTAAPAAGHHAHGHPPLQAEHSAGGLLPRPPLQQAAPRPPRRSSSTGGGLRPLSSVPAASAPIGINGPPLSPPALPPHAPHSAPAHALHPPAPVRTHAPFAASGRDGSPDTASTSAPAGGKDGLPFSLADLRTRLTELNQLAADGGTDAVELIVYRDGMRFHNRPVRPYTDATVKAIISDILDGYFPSVLKSSFPDGVRIMVVDCSRQAMDHGGSPRASNIHSFDEIGSGAHNDGPMSREKFLSKLPQSVIRNGKVVDVRGGVSKMLAGDSGPPVAAPMVVHTSADELLSTIQRNHVGPSLPPSSASKSPSGAAPEVTTLQVKSEDGQQTYIIKLQYDETVTSLRKYIDVHRAKPGGAAAASYEIRTSYPNRVYADGAESLRQAGLVPNATLFLKAIK